MKIFQIYPLATFHCVILYSPAVISSVISIWIILGVSFEKCIVALRCNLSIFSRNRTIYTTKQADIIRLVHREMTINRGL